jgi:ABC transporter
LLVPRGSAFGYLGPNGAGKTTLIRTLLGLTMSNAGTMSLLGTPVPAERATALARVGAIVDEPRFHPHLTGRDNLRLLAAARGGDADQRIAPSLARVGLAERAGDKVAAYSMGMRQRLGVAACLLADPELACHRATHGPAGQPRGSLGRTTTSQPTKRSSRSACVSELGPADEWAQSSCLAPACGLDANAVRNARQASCETISFAHPGPWNRAQPPGSRSRCSRPVMSDIQLCVMQGYLAGAHHRVKLVLYLVLGVGDLPGLHPEVLHVIAAA